jgi:uncharacterized Zn finger protein
MKALRCKHCGQMPFESIEEILGDQVVMLSCRKCEYGVHVPIEKQKSDALSDTFTHMSVVAKQTQKAYAKWNELNGGKESRTPLVDMLDSIVSDPSNSKWLGDLSKALSEELKRQNEQEPLPKFISQHLETYDIPISFRDKLAFKIDLAFKSMKGPDDHFAVAISLADEIVKALDKPKTKEPKPCPHCGAKPVNEVVSTEYRLKCPNCKHQVTIPLDLTKAIRLATSPDPKERSKAWDATFPLATDAYKELVEKWNSLV